MTLFIHQLCSNAYDRAGTVLDGGDTIMNKTKFQLYHGAYILVGGARKKKEFIH